ncbi:meiotic recombination protein REC114 [Tachyglossus aculeatus]|uniref:meiotic recombination protein REC114 n=1 Tax=Tachyglossus aculeatus TaxID=9261 RepID=UPI0018F78BBD|nr:meiotic recombination protein REC114 [Tachyglossus aculeatus]
MAEPGEAAAAAFSCDQWPLQRYGRFVVVGPDEPNQSEEERGSLEEAGPGRSPSLAWKVFKSDGESGSLTLTIVVSGHFFISRGETLLEGLSLIHGRQYLKVMRRMDCLLFGSTAKNKSRMFRVQFGGDSKEQALEHCRSCVQKLAQYVTVEESSGPSQEFLPGFSQLTGSESQPHQSMENHQVPSQARFPEGKMSVTQLAESLLSSPLELPLAYQQSRWSTEELGPFLRLCLLDQSFPAFVEEVEQELRKLTGFKN